MTTAHDFTLKGIDGAPLPISRFQGQVMLLVNVASQCGFTPQYRRLEEVYREFRDKGFVVLGVPCNQFGGQEPGSEEEILRFCQEKYDVTFPLAAKTEVMGENAHPLYVWLTKHTLSDPGPVEWNFEKFLVGRDGQILGRYRSLVSPEDEGFLNDLLTALG